MRYTFMRFPNFRRKAVTLSYDDGKIYDKKLIEIMDKHGLKGTFNLNGGLFPKETGGIRLTKEEAYALYVNSPHEVAAHGYEHLSLGEIGQTAATCEVLKDREILEETFGCVIKGMAYANGSWGGDHVLQAAKSSGICYARTTVSTEKFNLPEDWLRMPGTCHHNNPRLMELAQKFVEAKESENPWANYPMLFYLWGHSYEFNDNDNWNVIEEFGEYIGNREEIWYATNGEIYDYVQAYQNLHFSANGDRIYNPSAIDVCLCYRGKNVLVPSGKTVKV